MTTYDKSLLWLADWLINRLPWLMLYWLRWINLLLIGLGLSRLKFRLDTLCRWSISYIKLLWVAWASSLSSSTSSSSSSPWTSASVVAGAKHAWRATETVVQSLADAGTGEGVSFQPLPQPTSPCRDRLRRPVDRTTGEDLVPEPQDEVEERPSSDVQTRQRQQPSSFTRHSVPMQLSKVGESG